MKMLLLMLLVGFSTLTTGEEVAVIETPGSPVVVIETPGSPVVIESAAVGLGTNRNDPTIVLVALQARSAGRDIVDQFTARVDIIGQDGRVRGFVARSQGPVYPESASYEVPLQSWATGKGDQLRITVTMARLGNRSWVDGVWTEDEDTEIPQGLACGRDFCLSMSIACNVTCKRAGCVLSFKCSMGPKSCDVECICRQNVICGGP
jgi:hypothetical protein